MAAVSLTPSPPPESVSEISRRDRRRGYTRGIENRVLKIHVIKFVEINNASIVTLNICISEINNVTLVSIFTNVINFNLGLLVCSLFPILSTRKR